MHVAATQILDRYHLAGGGLHQRRSAQEDGALVPDDDRFVGHGRHVSATGGAGSHDHGDLRDALGGHIGLVEENAAKVVPVGKNLILFWQKRAARVHQIDAGQVVLLGDFLGAQVFFHGQRIIGAALHRGVVGDDHAFAALHPANAGNHARRRRFVVVEAVGRQLADFEEGRTGIEQVIHPLPR